MENIDFELEKLMIAFVYKEKAIRRTQLDTFWKQFMAAHCEFDLNVDDLRLHFLLMNKDENKWGLDEEVFAYIRFGAWAEETDIPSTEEDLLDMEKLKDLEFKDKLLVTFQRRQNYRVGLSNDTYRLFKPFMEVSGSHNSSYL